MQGGSGAYKQGALPNLQDLSVAMTTPSVLDVVAAPANAIGRYFTVLSVVPSTMFVAYCFALLTARPWYGSPNWSRTTDAFTGLGIGGVAGLALASLLTGLLLQPLQYSLVQLCEGYWGVRPLPQALMTRRIAHHRDVREDLLRAQGRALARLNAAGVRPGDPDSEAADLALLPDVTRYGETTRLLDQYPEDPDDVRPTRLGNVLRRHEASAGAAYRLPGVTVTPHLALVAPNADLAYLDDQRTQMDLAVRLAVLSAFATGVTAAATVRSGLWLLLALLPYAATYVFYRGAVGRAQGYGTAIAILVDLNRFALYDRLRMVPPPDTAAERDMNASLARLLRDHEQQDLPLAQPPPPEQTGPSPA